MREIFDKNQPLCRVGHLIFLYWPGFTADLAIAGESAAMHGRLLYKAGVIYMSKVQTLFICKDFLEN